MEKEMENYYLGLGIYWYNGMEKEMETITLA